MLCTLFIHSFFRIVKRITRSQSLARSSHDTSQLVNKNRTHELPFRFSFTDIPIVAANVTASVTSMSSLFVRWDPIPFRPLDGYVISVTEIDTGLVIQSVKANKTFVHLTALAAYTNYSLEVAGYNAWEVGPNTIAIYKKIEQIGESCDT